MTTTLPAAWAYHVGGRVETSDGPRDFRYCVAATCADSAVRIGTRLAAREFGVPPERVAFDEISGPSPIQETAR